MRNLVLVFCVALAGCGGGNATTHFSPPVVDMTGVDANRYNSDLGECTRRKQEAGSVTFGAIITLCMRDKGYKILEARG